MSLRSKVSLLVSVAFRSHFFVPDVKIMLLSKFEKLHLGALNVCVRGRETENPWNTRI